MERSDESFYIYRPLDPLSAEIRLLQVLNISEHTNAIHCTLSNECLLPYGSVLSSRAAPVFNRPAYKALSYVWGDASRDGEILIDGCRLRITLNLDTAIRYLYADGHLQMHIWIDAVCVNQDDVAERSSQVLLMRRVYQNAQSVIIWLGTYSAIGGQDKTFDLIEDLLEGTVDADASCEYEDGVWEPTVEAVAKFEEKLGDESILWAAQLISNDLVGRHAWWSRIWVVQELAVSANATVHRGHRHLEWRDLHRVAEWFETQHERIFGGKYLGAILNLGKVRSRWIQGEPVSRQGLLAACSGSDCTDPRDKVWALLGIVSEDSDLLYGTCIPDYGAPISQAYATATVFSIASRKSLNCICSEHHWRSSQGDLPSWVPDLKSRSNPDSASPLLQLGDSKQIWNASGTKNNLINWQATSSTQRSLPHLRPIAHDGHLWLKILKVSCVVVDIVSEVSARALSPFVKAGSLEPWERTMKTRFGNPYSTKWSFSMQDIVRIFERYRALVRGERPLPEFRSPMAELQESQPRPDEVYVAGTETVLEAWIRTVLADQVQDYERATEAEITAFCRCRCPPDFLRHLNLEIKDRVERFMGLLFLACADGTRGKRLIITEKGYIGSVPVEARQGDLLCVLIGCDVPVLLRRKLSPDDNIYMLVSEAYVCGLMDGEAIQLLNDGVLKVQNIVLE